MKLVLNAVGAVMGGAARHLPPFVAALSAARPDWELEVCLAERSSLAPRLESYGRIRRVPDRPWHRRLAWDFVAVNRFVPRSQADCLVNLTNSGPLRPGVPSILYQRNPIYFDPSWVRQRPPLVRADAWARRRLAFAQMRPSAAVVTPSEAMAAYLRAWRGCPQAVPIAVIPHAVDLERFFFVCRPLAPAGHVSLVVVNHPAPHKGLDTAVRATAELVSLGIDASLTLTIDGQDDRGPLASAAEGLARLAGELGIAQRVRFAGRVERVEDLYHEADLALVPSLTESFGFPVIEAMAAGTPVVASRIPSTVELLGDFGRYHTPGDHLGAAQQILSWLEASADEHDRLVEAARRRAESFSWARNAESLATLAERCAGVASFLHG